VPQIISSNGIETATNGGVLADDFGKMRNVWQHRDFLFDAFDQMAYSFRHNGNMRPAVVNDFPGVSVLAPRTPLQIVMARKCGPPS
jgi:hypothetical protein